VTERFPVSPCRRCGKPLDAATGVIGADTPGAGDVSICAYCGTVALFDSDLRLRPPTEDEIDALLGDDSFVEVIGRMMDTMGTEIDDGVVFRCGCRIGWREHLFTLVACAPDCVLAHRVIQMAAESGKPYSVIR
jgi:hypothetical protein